MRDVKGVCDDESSRVGVHYLHRAPEGPRPPQASHDLYIPEFYKGLLFTFDKVCILWGGHFYSTVFNIF